jgi:hypothetical protein
MHRVPCRPAVVVGVHVDRRAVLAHPAVRVQGEGEEGRRAVDPAAVALEGAAPTVALSRAS